MVARRGVGGQVSSGDARQEAAERPEVLRQTGQEAAERPEVLRQTGQGSPAAPRE